MGTTHTVTVSPVSQTKKQSHGPVARCARHRGALQETKRRSEPRALDTQPTTFSRTLVPALRPCTRGLARGTYPSTLIGQHKRLVGDMKEF